jgi:CrcB protein
MLAAAGAAGTLCRYGLGGLVQSGLGTRLPWSTLVVNVVGCFAAGLLFGLFENRWAFSGETRVIVFIGFMGAFTTFSSYMLETSELARDAQLIAAAGNMVLQNGLGAVALFAGLVAARLA